MMLPSKAVYKTLKSKGVKNIHHANSVITSCQFLRAGALLSRGSVEKKGAPQSPQSSDKIDRQRSVWFDVFVDSVDIHTRGSNLNKYGPVLFVLDLDVINDLYTGGIWITKLNPTKWEGTEHKERWFTSAEELESNFVPGEFDQMIVFRHCGGALPFERHLKKIVLDDPELRSKKSNIDYYSMAFGALQLSMTEGNLDVQIEKRKCSSGCKCIGEYLRNLDKAKSMYTPRLKFDGRNLPIPRK